MPGPQLTGKHLLSGLCCGPDMSGPQLTGKHLLSGLCCGPDMSGPYRVTMANGSCGGVKTPPYRSGSTDAL